MIKSAHLQNCQSHKDTYVEFHKGVNVFVGDTDAGKSSFLRGLRYCIWNEPKSKTLLSHWGGVLKVQLEVDNNIIIRESGNKEIYQLNDTVFNSFGVKVPEEIAKAFNMEDINSQEQIDSFFLINETSSYVASYLNKVANLEQIDETTKAIKAELNETKRLIESKTKDLEKKNTEKESFAFLPDFNRELEEANSIQTEIFQLSIEISVIQHLISEVKDCNKEIAIYEDLLNIKKDVNSAIDLIWSINDTELKIKKIKQLINSVSEIDKQMEELSKLAGLHELVNDSLKLKSKQNDLEAKLDSLNNILSKILSIDEKIENYNSEIDKDKAIYETELHKLGKCFFCGQKIK